MGPRKEDRERRTEEVGDKTWRMSPRNNHETNTKSENDLKTRCSRTQEHNNYHLSISMNYYYSFKPTT